MELVETYLFAKFEKTTVLEPVIEEDTVENVIEDEEVSETRITKKFVMTNRERYRKSEEAFEKTMLDLFIAEEQIYEKKIQLVLLIHDLFHDPLERKDHHEELDHMVFIVAYYILFWSRHGHGHKLVGINDVYAEAYKTRNANQESCPTAYILFRFDFESLRGVYKTFLYNIGWIRTLFECTGLNSPLKTLKFSRMENMVLMDAGLNCCGIMLATTIDLPANLSYPEKHTDSSLRLHSRDVHDKNVQIYGMSNLFLLEGEETRLIVILPVSQSREN